MTDQPWIPRQVQHMMDHLLEHTGTPAVLTAQPGRWHLEHSNERIRLTCTYTRRTTGRKLRYSSSLYQDGQRREKVDGIESYARLFKDPDIAHPNRTPGKQLPPVMPLTDDAEPPALVTTIVESARKARTVMEVEYGHAVRSTRETYADGMMYRVPVGESEEDYTADPELYTVRITKPNRDQVQINIGPTGRGGHYAIDDMAAVDADGGDMLSKLAQVDIYEVLESILGFRLPGANTGPGQHDARTKNTSGAVTNSVAVRKSTVIRV